MAIPVVCICWLLLCAWKRTIVDTLCQQHFECVNWYAPELLNLKQKQCRRWWCCPMCSLLHGEYLIYVGIYYWALLSLDRIIRNQWSRKFCVVLVTDSHCSPEQYTFIGKLAQKTLLCLWYILPYSSLQTLSTVGVVDSSFCMPILIIIHPNSKIHGANMGSIWGRQDPGGPHAGPMNFAICTC